jgi:hypothetical protein
MATIWTYVHITAAFICSCLPFLKPLLIQVASGTRHVSQYARSLLSLGSRHSETIPEDENNLRRKGDDSASGDTSIRMHNYKGRAWIPPNPKEYQHITEARGPSKSDIPSTLSTPGAISVQNEFHVVWESHFMMDLLNMGVMSYGPLDFTEKMFPSSLQ